MDPVARQVGQRHGWISHVVASGLSQRNTTFYHVSCAWVRGPQEFCLRATRATGIGGRFPRPRMSSVLAFTSPMLQMLCTSAPL